MFLNYEVDKILFSIQNDIEAELPEKFIRVKILFTNGNQLIWCIHGEIVGENHDRFGDCWYEIDTAEAIVKRNLSEFGYDVEKLVIEHAYNPQDTEVDIAIDE